MFKTLSKIVDKMFNKIEGVDKLTKAQKREIKRKLLRREYIKRSIRHFGNFSPVKPFRW